MSAGAERRRVVDWALPPPPDAALSGLDQLRLGLEGARPVPISALIGQRLVSVAPGRVAMEIDPAEYHGNTLGTVHGGILATLLDSVMTCAAVSQLPPGRFCTTMDFRIAFHRAATATSGTLTAEGTVLQGGRQVIAAAGRVTDGAGRLYATGTTGCFAFDLKAPGSAAAEPACGTREVRWSDPAALDEARKGMAGLAFVAALRNGALPPPPAVALYGVEMQAASAEGVEMSMPIGEWLFNPGGTVHGGAIALLLDSAMGCAVHAQLPAGRGFTTLELTVRFHRPATLASGPLRAVAQVDHGGRQVAAASGVVMDAADRLCASARCTCLVIGA